MKKIIILMVSILFSIPNVFAKDIWYCPMHPHYTSDRPGDCPICNMKLVKREEAGKHAEHEKSALSVPGYANVSVSGPKEQLVGIKTAVVSKKPIAKTLRVTGQVTTNHDLYVFQDEYIKAYTDYVTAYRDSHRFEHKRRNWEPHREIQLRLHEAEDKLLRMGFGKSQIEELQKYSWKTPWDKPPIQFLEHGFEYWISAQIFEKDLGLVDVGQEVDVDILAYNEKAKGVIRSIGGVINPETRTVNALIELTNYNGELKGYMLVNASIHVELSDSLVVPREAVMDTGIRKIVFIQKGEGLYEPRVIETGWETDDGFEIKSGLKEGEKIVTSGNFLLDSESRVQAGLEGEGHVH